VSAYDVAFYLPSLGPLLSPDEGLAWPGGAETQIWLLARGLAQRGRAVCVVVTDTPGGLPAIVDGVDVVVRAPWQGGAGTRGRIRELVELWRTLAPLRAKVVVQRTAGLSTGLVGAITRLRRRRFVYSSANVVDFDFETLASSPTELRLFHLGARLANAIVVQTEEQAACCMQKLGRRATVIGSIAEPASPRAGPPEAFLWVGRLVAYKRPEAFLDLARALPEARFRIVGLPSQDDPGLGRVLELRARELANVELLGPRSRPELLALYDTAAAVVNTADFEGMPNVFLEGWARGVPALALTHDPDRVISAHRLGGFAHGSQARLVALARELWAAREDQAVLAGRCREYVRHEHGIDAALRKWIALLDLDGRQQPAAAEPRGLGAASYGGVG
jgi:glycosyltransferase involved in cell wall biosynthesis